MEKSYFGVMLDCSRNAVMKPEKGKDFAKTINTFFFYSYLFFNIVFKSDYSLLVYLQVVIYSLATAIMLSIFFSHTAALLTATIPKTFFAALYIPSISQFSFFGST